MLGARYVSRAPFGGAADVDDRRGAIDESSRMSTRGTVWSGPFVRRHAARTSLPPRATTRSMPMSINASRALIDAPEIVRQQHDVPVV